MDAHDLLIRRGKVFDGSGAPPCVADVRVRDGRIVAVSEAPIAAAPGTRVLEAEGCWVMPGFIDIHTHYDAEVLIAPALAESLRHGVTTCFTGSCSISMIYSEPEDASDIFTRVESIPREQVLPMLRRTKHWRDAAGYIAHIESLPLGPNIASYMGHSDLRVAVMGLHRAVDAKVRPTEAEMQAMERHLDDGIDRGLLGMSGMTNPWDKVDGDRERSKSLPATYATWKEYRRLHRLLRRRGAVLQSAPNLNNPLNAVFYLLTSASAGVRKALKTTLITLMDIKAKPGQDKLGLFATRIFNRFMGADFRWQALPQPFAVYADGVDFVVFEEFPAGEMALHLKQDFDRRRLFADPVYRGKFKRDYRRKWGGRVWQRDFGDARVTGCPDAALVGRSIADIAHARGVHEVDAFLDLMIEHGSALRWSTTIGNHDPARLAANLNEACGIIGFSDAGAHIRNMAFYNFPLHLLQLAQRGVMPVEKAVWRLTGEIAEWFGLDAGHLREGGRADVVVIDPRALGEADLGAYAEAPFEAMGGVMRMVNRNPGVVAAVLVNGCIAFEGDEASPALGREQGFGRFLRRHGVTGA